MARSQLGLVGIEKYADMVDLQIDALTRRVMPQTETMTEMQITLHFDEQMNWNLLDVASLAGMFEEEFSLIQQSAALPPASMASFFQPQLQLVEAPALPRLILRTPAEPYAIQLQLDRFSFSWANQSPLSGVVEYPGYESLKAECLRRAETLSTWHSPKFGSPPRLKIIEVTYWNMIPLQKSDGTNRRLSEIFKFVNPGRFVNQFNTTWAELLDTRENSPFVRIQAGLGQSNNASVAHIQNVIFFTLTGVAPLNCSLSDSVAILQMADALHERIVDVYKNSIISNVS